MKGIELKGFSLLRGDNGEFEGISGQTHREFPYPER
jgi:hypothetical protein